MKSLIKKSQSDWDLYYLGVARSVARGSKDPSTKCGAVVVKNNRIVATGFNSFPVGTDDVEEDYYDREVKLEKIKHAEVAALENIPASNEPYTLYVWPFMPCIDCAEYSIGWNVRRIVSTDYTPDDWRESLAKTISVLDAKDIKHMQYKIGMVI